MKNLLFFIVAVLMMVSSCKKDDAPVGSLDVILASTSPIPQSSVVVSKTTTTKDVIVMEFVIKTSDAISIDILPVIINSSGNLSDLISEAKLKIGNAIYAVADIITSSKTESTITFNNLLSPIEIGDNSKINVKVIVDIKPIIIQNKTSVTTTVKADQIIAFNKNYEQINFIKKGSVIGPEIILIN